MTNWFLPEDYQQPETQSNYLKFKKDWNTEFRVMSDAITWYVYFNTENKPQRSKQFPELWEASAKVNDKWGKDKPKHFRSFVVRDYATKKINILEVTQKSIQNDIMAYYKNEKRWDPKEYDFTVTRKWEGLDTKYTVIANPKTALTEEQASKYLDSKINLEALYDWEDPFMPF